MIQSIMMKPKLTRFQQVAAEQCGNISKIADAFGVGRASVYRWLLTDEKFKSVIEEQRGRLLDRCIESAALLANGVPSWEESANGPVFKGWKVMPDGNMLRYLISTLGRKEGFGESTAIDITSKGEKLIPEPIQIEVIDRREQVEKEENE